MRTILLSAGLAKLDEQTYRDDKLYITGFELGARSVSKAQIEAWDNQEAGLTAMQGQLVLQADHTMVTYLASRPNQIQLTGYIPENVPQIEIGNVTFFCGYEAGERVPFSFSATDASSIKIETQRDSPGYGYWFNLMLRIPNLEDRFDFSNLERKVPEFLRVASEQYLPRPSEDSHDQFIINHHTEYGGVHLIVNAQNRHMGCPFADWIRLGNPVKQWVISGGTVGDGYRHREI